MAACVRHPEAVAVGGCPACHAPFCAACRVEDIARELAFCSPICRERGPAAELPRTGARVSDADLLVGYRHPIREGFALWKRTFPTVLRHLAPVALAMGGFLALVAIVSDSIGDEVEVGVTVIAIIFAILASIGAFGIALAAVVLSHAHTGRVTGSPVRHALRRFAPWSVVWVLFLTASAAGSLVYVVPGIIIGIRLFWADEYALVEGFGPFAAFRESWRVTSGYSVQIFVVQILLSMLNLLLLLPVLVLMTMLLDMVDVGGPRAVVSGVRFFAAALAGLIAYASLHAPEVVYFYGLRAHRAEMEPAGD